jgi:hypothetical protein
MKIGDEAGADQADPQPGDRIAAVHAFLPLALKFALDLECALACSLRRCAGRLPGEREHHGRGRE